MTGPEFAQAHGDSSNWTATDFEVELNLAEIDALPEPVKAWTSMAQNLQASIDRIRAERGTQPAA